jgi:hypothetical protein
MDSKSNSIGSGHTKESNEENITQQSHSYSSSASSSSTPFPHFGNFYIPSVLDEHTVTSDREDKGKYTEIFVCHEQVEDDSDELEIMVGERSNLVNVDHVSSTTRCTSKVVECDVVISLNVEIAGSASKGHEVVNNSIVFGTDVSKSLATHSLSTRSPSPQSQLLHSLQRLRSTTPETSTATLSPPLDLRTSSASSLHHSIQATNSDTIAPRWDIARARPRGATMGSSSRATYDFGGRSMEITESTPSSSLNIVSSPQDSSDDRTVGDQKSKRSRTRKNRFNKLFNISAPASMNSSLSSLILVPPGFIERDDHDILSPNTRFRSQSAPILISIPPSLQSSPATIGDTPYHFKQPINHFELKLPCELQLKVVASIGTLCVEEFEQLKRDGRWRIRVDKSGKWWGELKGLRAIIKIGRVTTTARIFSSSFPFLFTNDELSLSGIAEFPSVIPRRFTLEKSVVEPGN